MDTHTGLNNLDYIVLGIVLLSGVFALVRGFVREILALVTWALALIAAAKFGSLAEPWVSHYTNNETLVSYGSKASVFLGSFIILAIVSTIIGRFIRGRALTAIDRSLGFIFGVARGALFVSVIYLTVTAVLWPHLDKPTRQADIQAEPQPAAPAESSTTDMGEEGYLPPTTSTKDEESTPPKWLAEARTRPAMAYGASLLEAIISKKSIQDKTQKYFEQKAAARRLIEETSKGISGSQLLTNDNAKTNSSLNHEVQGQAIPSQKVTP